MSVTKSKQVKVCTDNIGGCPTCSYGQLNLFYPKPSLRGGLWCWPESSKLCAPLIEPNLLYYLSRNWIAFSGRTDNGPVSSNFNILSEYFNSD
ncbi:hypothetical protein AVEN_262377-1 [Araneus ventricosus]|uniref:Uncharacterized protein n=1 Tax=Araneus ventricosus TaxID=182803 RepID=A0A4Y2VL40_ARAVE|nr:hypothetical protein AVEN_262377-1 [Araneus ventricosus]